MPRRFAIYGEGAAAQAPEYFTEQTTCIDIDGSSEWVGNGAEQAYDFANAFTIAFWIKPSGVTFSNSSASLVFLSRVAGGFQNRVYIDVLGATDGDPLRVRVYNSFGTLFKEYHWDRFLLSGEWNFVACTWDSTNLKVYRNGIAMVPTATPTDTTGSRTNDSTLKCFLCNISGGNYSAARLHEVGFWSSALTSGEVSFLYNNLNGKAIDWGNDSGTYASSADLQHWWRLGHDADDIGKDYGVAGAIDMMADASGIDAGDIASDSPDGVFTAQSCCLDLDGAGESLFDLTEKMLGIGNAWTAAMWFKPASGAFAQSNWLVDVEEWGGAGSHDRIAIQLLGQYPNDPIRALCKDVSGATIKDYFYDGVATQDAWNFLVLTWDGSAMNLYMNGSGVTVTSAWTDVSGSMQDSIRQVRVAGYPPSNWTLDGRFHSLGLWSCTLASAEAAALYNSGDGDAVDWAKNAGGYSSAADLQHWWRLGHLPGNLGADFGRPDGEAIDVMADANGVSDADRTSDSP